MFGHDISLGEAVEQSFSSGFRNDMFDDAKDLVISTAVKIRFKNIWVGSFCGEYFAGSTPFPATLVIH